MGTFRINVLSRVYLCIVDHVDTLKDDIPGMFTQECEYVSHRCLVWKTPQSNAIPVSTAGDELLRQHYGSLG